MEDYPPPMCMYCRNYASDDDEEEVPVRCRAYPDGIPKSIWHSERDHRKPARGDHGIRFEPFDGTPDDSYWDARFATQSG